MDALDFSGQADPEPIVDVSDPVLERALQVNVKAWQKQGLPEHEIDKRVADLVTSMQKNRGIDPAEIDLKRHAALSGLTAEDSFAANGPPPPAPGNIDLNKRKAFPNEDGTVSTVKSKSFGIDGAETLLPSISADDGRDLTDEEVIANYRNTGQHLGRFKTRAEADAFAQKLHESEAARTGAPDFSGQADTTGLDFSGQATPVETTGVLDSLGTGLAHTGGVILGMGGRAARAMNPALDLPISQAEADLEREKQAKAKYEFRLPGGPVKPPYDTTRLDAARARLDAFDPVGAASRQALAYGRDTVPANRAALAARDLGEIPGGVLETGAAAATGVGSLVPAGLAGLGAVGNNALIDVGLKDLLGLSPMDAKDAIEAAKEKYTYQPRTEVGQELTGAVGWLADIPHKVGGVLADHLQDLAPSHAAGAAALQTLFDLVPFGFGVRRVGPRFRIPDDVITPEQVDIFQNRPLGGEAPPGGWRAPPGGGGGPGTGPGPARPHPNDPMGDVRWEIYLWKHHEWEQGGRVGPEPQAPELGGWGTMWGPEGAGAAPAGAGAPPPPGGPSARPTTGAGQGAPAPAAGGGIRGLLQPPEVRAPPELREPSITVNKGGQAVTTEIANAEARQALDRAAQANKARQGQIDLGLTPDIIRIMSQKWDEASARAAADAAAMDARKQGPLTEQRRYDEPMAGNLPTMPWWQESGEQRWPTNPDPTQTQLPLPQPSWSPPGAPAAVEPEERKRRSMGPPPVQSDLGLALGLPPAVGGKEVPAVSSPPAAGEDPELDQLRAAVEKGVDPDTGEPLSAWGLQQYAAILDQVETARATAKAEGRAVVPPGATSESLAAKPAKPATPKLTKKQSEARAAEGDRRAAKSDIDAGTKRLRQAHADIIDEIADLQNKIAHPELVAHLHPLQSGNLTEDLRNLQVSKMRIEGALQARGAAVPGAKKAPMTPKAGPVMSGGKAASIPTPESLGDTRHYTLDWRAGKWNEDLRGKQRKPDESEMAIAPLTEVDFKAHIKPITRFKTLDELRQHYPGATHFRMIRGMAGKKPLVQFAGAGTLESLRPTSSDKVMADQTKIFEEEQAAKGDAKAKPKPPQDFRPTAADVARGEVERYQVPTRPGMPPVFNTIHLIDQHLFETYVKPALGPAGGNTLAEFRKRTPFRTHVELRHEKGTTVLRGLGSLESLRATQSGKPMERAEAAPAAKPPTTPAAKPKERDLLQAAFYKFTPDDADLVHGILAAKLKRMGDLATLYIPTEFTNKIGTAELSGLREVMKSNPQAVVDYLEQKAKGEPAPTPARLLNALDDARAELLKLKNRLYNDDPTPLASGKARDKAHDQVIELDKRVRAIEKDLRDQGIEVPPDKGLATPQAKAESKLAAQKAEAGEWPKTDLEDAASAARKIANDKGIDSVDTVFAAYRRLPNPSPTKTAPKAEIEVAQGKDGKWRERHNRSVGTSYSGSPWSRESFPTKRAALEAAIDALDRGRPIEGDTKAQQTDINKLRNWINEQRAALDQPLKSRTKKADRTKPLSKAKQEALEIAGPSAQHLTASELSGLNRTTADQFAEIRATMPSAKELANVSLAGIAKLHWYRNTARAILEIFGHKDAARFSALLASGSPRVLVEENLLNTLSIWRDWDRAGRPSDPRLAEAVNIKGSALALADRKKVGTKIIRISRAKADAILVKKGFPMDLAPLARQQLQIMAGAVRGDGTIKSVLPGWIGNSLRAFNHPDPANLVLSGPKVHSFGHNVRGILSEVTNDAWMSILYGVAQELFGGALTKSGPGKRAGYLAANALAREAAEYATKLTGRKWEPAEIQATSWAFTKTALELADSQKAKYKALAVRLANATTPARRAAITAKMDKVKAKGLTVPQLVRSGAVTHKMIASTPAFGDLLNEPRFAKILEEAGLPKPTPGQKISPSEYVKSITGTGRKAAAFAPDAREVGRAARRIELKRQERAAAKAESLRTRTKRTGKVGELPPPDSGAWRPVVTPELVKRNQYDIDQLVKRFDGSVLMDTFNRDYADTQASQLVGQVATTLQDKAAAEQVYRQPHFEISRLTFYDDAGRVLFETAMSSRMAGAVAAFPLHVNTASELKAWIKSMAPPGATKYSGGHNHPPGDVTPSNNDIETTMEYGQNVPEGLEYLGEIITNHQSWAHIKPNGVSSVHDFPTDKGPDPLKTYPDHPSAHRQVIEPEQMAWHSKQFYGQIPKGHIGLMTTDLTQRIRTLSTVPVHALTSKRGGALLSMLGKRGGGSDIYVIGDIDRINQHIDAINQAAKIGLISDAIGIHTDGHVESLRQQGKITVNPGGFPEFARRPGKDRRPGYVSNEYKGRQKNAGDTPLRSREKNVPSRRPGESQRDYAGRMARAANTSFTDWLTSWRNRPKLTKDDKVNRNMWRGLLAKVDRAGRMSDHAFREFTKAFDESSEVINLATIHEYETGRIVGHPNAAAFFRLAENLLDTRIAAIQVHQPEALQTLYAHYFAHIWEDTGKARAWYEEVLAKNPLRGDRSFLKPRTHMTVRDGMNAGLRLVDDNPATVTLLKLHQMDKLVAWLDFKADLEQRGQLRKMQWDQRPPEGYSRVDDPAFNHNKGYYAAPTDIAGIINNYLKPGLEAMPGFRGLRAFQNTIIAARLGISAFHAGFTTADTMVTSLGSSINRIAVGDVEGAIKDLGRSMKGLTAPFFEGRRLQRAWLDPANADPTTATILGVLETAGARLKMSPSDYNQARYRVRKAWRRKSLEGWGGEGKMRHLRRVGDLLSTVGEMLGWVIHHWLVPKQKLVARVHLMKGVLDHYANDPYVNKQKGDYLGIIHEMDPITLQGLAADVVDTIDNRLGQMTYDNQFWNKIALQASQTILMAPGWLVGSVRVGVGGITDLRRLVKPEELLGPVGRNAPPGSPPGKGQRLTYRVTGLIALAALMMSINKVTQQLLTGEPMQGKDWFFPRTGRRNLDDSEERLQYPTYWMDHYKLTHEPWQTLMNKLNPTWAMLYEWMRNLDYHDIEIRDKDADAKLQAADTAKFVAKGAIPFSVTNIQKLEESGAEPGREFASVLGVNTAPMSVTQSEFQKYIAEKVGEHMPKGGRSQDQAAQSDKTRAIAARIRAGEDVDLEEELPTRKQRLQAMSQGADLIPERRFKRLEFKDKVTAFEKATAKEIDRYHLAEILANEKPEKSAPFQAMSPEKQQDLLDRRRALLQESGWEGD